MARSNRGISGFARVANNLKKMGYYPMTDQDASLIGSWLEGENYLMLDSCCGSGKALKVIKDMIDGDGEAFGVELEEGRAEARVPFASRKDREFEDIVHASFSS